MNADDYTLIDWSFLQQSPPAKTAAFSQTARPLFSTTPVQAAEATIAFATARTAAPAVFADARVPANQPIELDRSIADLLGAESEPLCG